MGFKKRTSDAIVSNIILPITTSIVLLFYLPSLQKTKAAKRKQYIFPGRPVIILNK
jgi:hypothetical protein